MDSLGQMLPLTTQRLILRHWLDADRVPFARINADPRVMEFMPASLTAAQTNALADRIESHFQQHGFGLCAAELRATNCFIGYVGLSVPSFTAHFTPCVEIGWRLDADHWGHGLATEAAQEIVRYAFEVLRLPSLVSFTVPANTRSRRIMEKLNMTHNPADDFDHPNLPQGHPLRPHVLYRLDLPSSSQSRIHPDSPTSARAISVSVKQEQGVPSNFFPLCFSPCGTIMGSQRLHAGSEKICDCSLPAWRA